MSEIGYFFKLRPWQAEECIERVNQEIPPLFQAMSLLELFQSSSGFNYLKVHVYPVSMCARLKKLLGDHLVAPLPKGMESEAQSFFQPLEVLAKCACQKYGVSTRLVLV